MAIADAANYAGTPFSGAVAFDLRGEVPLASLWLAAGPVDIGQLLRKLKIVEDLDARVESLRVQLTGRGSRLGGGGGRCGGRRFSGLKGGRRGRRRHGGGRRCG